MPRRNRRRRQQSSILIRSGVSRKRRLWNCVARISMGAALIATKTTI